MYYFSNIFIYKTFENTYAESDILETLRFPGGLQMTTYFFN